MRIAEATEKMAGNYTQLQDDKDRYYKWWQESRKENERLNRRISALQGVITKMKKAKKANV